ncbi:MFS transporter [Bosea sp. (in: a-proteobacteria)]|uniref:MFS transporter n=1 Tax=Bosea sp. (in: a-proteobacteria) TaxID=1871050 RepID=UPI0025BBBFF5|nr:MFS transporter [Bosea sp. (in: a-proteobacteria)]
MGKIDETAGRATAGRTDWWVVALVVAAGIAASFQIGKAAIAIPLLQVETGRDLAVLGWVSSIFAVLGLFGGVPVGALAARFGDRRMLLLGLLMLAIGSVLGAVASGLGLLLACRVVEGAGFLMVSVSGPALLRRCVGVRDREIAMALWSCFMPAGMALAMLLGPLFGGWRAIWLAGAGFALVVGVAVALRVPAAMAGAVVSWRQLAADAGSMFLTRGPFLLAVCFALYAMMFFAVLSFLPVLLIERMHSSLAVAGLLSGLATAGNIVGNLIAGALLARGVPRLIVLAGASFAMGLAAVFVFLPLLPPTGSFLSGILFATAGGFVPATLLSTAALLAPRPNLVPASIGLLMQGSNLGQVMGPTVVGLVISGIGWAGAAGLVAALALLAALTAFGLHRDLSGLAVARA